MKERADRRRVGRKIATIPEGDENTGTITPPLHAPAMCGPEGNLSVGTNGAEAIHR